MKKTVKQKPINSFQIDKYFRYRLNSDNTNRACLCDYTSIVNHHKNGLDMAWGTIWVWNKKWKEYQCPFFNHTWNLDDNDNVYDDYYSLNKVLEKTGINSIDVERDSYRYIDGSIFHNLMAQTEKSWITISERLKKKFKKDYSKPKIIFLSEVAWDNNDKPYSWESMEKKWEKIERTEIIEEIQR